jgi:hypothetical protein
VSEFGGVLIQTTTCAIVTAIAGGPAIFVVGYFLGACGYHLAAFLLRRRRV